METHRKSKQSRCFQASSAPSSTKGISTSLQSMSWKHTGKHLSGGWWCPSEVLGPTNGKNQDHHPAVAPKHTTKPKEAHMKTSNRLPAEHAPSSTTGASTSFGNTMLRSCVYTSAGGSARAADATNATAACRTAAAGCCRSGAICQMSVYTGQKMGRSMENGGCDRGGAVSDDAGSRHSVRVHA